MCEIGLRVSASILRRSEGQGGVPLRRWHERDVRTSLTPVFVIDRRSSGSAHRTSPSHSAADAKPSHT